MKSYSHRARTEIAIFGRFAKCRFGMFAFLERSNLELFPTECLRMSWWCICKDLHPSLMIVGVISGQSFLLAEFRPRRQFSDCSERSLSCLNSCAPLSLGVGFCRQLLVLKSSAPLGSNMCVYTQSNRNGVQSMVAISPNSQLPGFLIAGILVAIKTVIASTIGYA